LGWVPMFLHGPIPQKFDIYYIHGAVAVWAYYTARLLIGFWVGVAAWPERWWLRGPLCGVLVMLPVTFFSLAVPTCGPTGIVWNLASVTGAGAVVAGIASAIAGRHRA